MKHLKLISGILSATIIFAVQACPYTFINDTQRNIFLAEKISHGYFVKPGAQTIVEAPMNPEHEQHHAVSGINGCSAGCHKGTLHHHDDSNGHAAIYVYSEIEPGKYDVLFKIRERACGKDSVLKYSELEAMARGTQDAGRFGIKELHEAHKATKKSKLTNPVKK